MKGSQRKKPRPFVAATKPLDTPNLRKKLASRTIPDNAQEQRRNGQPAPAAVNATTDTNSTHASSGVFDKKYARQNGAPVANINKPMEKAERFLEGTLDMHPPTSPQPLPPRPTPQQPTFPLPPPTAQISTSSLVSKLKEYPIVLSKAKSSHGLVNGLDIVAKHQLAPGDLLLREQPHCLAVDVLFNRSHCAACMEGLRTTRLMCPSCNLVQYCSASCLGKDSGPHRASGECSWCAARDRTTNAAGEPEHDLVRLALRLMYAQPDMDPLDRKLLMKVPRYGQWFSAVASRLKPQALASMQPVLAIWRARVTALKKKAEQAKVACPLVDPDALHAAIYQMAVGVTAVVDLGGAQQGLAIYPLAPFLRHSCRPNAQMVFQEGQMELRAVRRVAPGEAITVALVELYCPPSRRRNALLQHPGYTCNCPRCKAPKVAEGWEGQLALWRKALSPEQKEAYLARLQDRLGMARKLLLLARTSKPHLLPKVGMVVQDMQRQCGDLLGPHHFLAFQVQLLAAELAEAEKDWQALLDLGPWLMQRMELSHPPHHPLLGWLARNTAMALHWLSENSDPGMLQRAADYADEARTILRVCCGPDHPTTREVSVLAAVVKRKLARI